MSAVDGIDEFAAKLAGILKEKNAAYGDSFARVPTILAGMYQDVPPETLEGILFTARILDKLGRIAQDPLAAGEDAYLDLAGYAMMMANMQRLKREAKAATGVMYLGDEAIEYRMPDGEPKAEAPSEPKAAFEPVLSPADCNRTERWLIRRNSDGKLLTWSFPDREAAERFIASYAPPARIKRDMAYAEVTQEPTGWYIVCFEGRDRQFFNDFGGFWAHDIRDATSFLSQEAAESCLRRREGAPHVVQTGSIIERPHTSHRVSGDGWVVCRNGRYLNCGDGDWKLFPDWGAQFPTKEAAEIVAQKVDPETGTWKASSCG